MASQQPEHDTGEQSTAEEEHFEQVAPRQEGNTAAHKRRPMSQESLERLLHTRDQIVQDRQGQPFSDSTEIIRQMREEDWRHEEISTSEPEQHEPRPMTKEALEGLLRLREQIKQNHPGQVFDDSTEIVRQMREERSDYAD